tara:strand:- start:8007 stop:8183 length:177 start_codon:yes stop_codon:yes gene_type:complete
MNIDNSPTHKYILIDTNLKPCYAKIHTAELSEKESKVKNYAFATNKVNQKYIKKEQWK